MFGLLRNFKDFCIISPKFGKKTAKFGKSLKKGIV